MSNIAAKDVQRLRNESGAGMMDCKKALLECEGDFDHSLTWLRKRGVEATEKRSAREAGEGLVVIARDGDQRSAMVEVNCETDFVARGDLFRDFTTKLAQCALKQSVEDIPALIQVPFDDQNNVEQARIQLAAAVGENVRIHRMALLDVDSSKEEKVISYVHGAQGGSAGKIGVIVRFDPGKGDAELGKHIAMHIAAMKPVAIKCEDVSPEIIAREKDILQAQAEKSGKNATVVEKMVEGRLRKWYSQSVLLEQSYIIDMENSVGDVLKKHTANVLGFTRFALGEKD